MSQEIKQLPRKTSRKEISSEQGALDLGVDKETEIQGIGMGVLRDGTAFLHQRGLAALCGVQNAHIGTIGTEWNDTNQRPRIAVIKDLLGRRGDVPSMPYVRAMRGGQVFLAYPDAVCAAILEYYAFEAGANYKEQARKNFRILAAKGLRDFIYTQVGYSPDAPEVLAWRQFHDRVSLLHDSVPHGYFSVFKEIADLMVTLIQSGASVGAKFLPDISVGQHWGQHWAESNLEARHGTRARYEHNYPDYFPQAVSNPQEPYCYPNAALGEFREWMWENYLPQQLPRYLERQEAKGLLPPAFAEKAVRAIEARRAPKRLPAA